MSFTVEKSKNFGVEEGVYDGRLVTLIDMGIQNRGTFKGEKLADAPIIGMEFEVIKEDGSRGKIFKEVVKSGHEQSTYYSIAKALLGGGSRADELLDSGIKADSIIGKPASISVGLTSGGKSKITAVTALKKGSTVDEPESELLIFTVSKPDEDVLAKLPKFVQTKLGVKLNKEDDDIDF